MTSLRPEGSELRGCRLLLAEDNMMLALSLALLLEMKGCCVFKSASCEQGLRLIQTQPFDIALLDVALIDGPVYPAAEALLELDVPIIFLTCYNAEWLPLSWRSYPIMEKTIDPDAIIQRVITEYRDI